MTTKSVGNIRLATGDGRSDLLYNAYHLLTQLSAMYTHFTAHAQSPEHKQIFESLSVDLLTDIGELYTACEALDKSSKTSMSKKVSTRLILTCNHLFRLLTLTDTWTPFVRMATLSGFVERRWLFILTELKVDAGKELAVLNNLTARGELRCRTVVAQLEKVKIKDRQAQKAFDTAESALLDKSFGF